jgi:hypothetical protein
LRSLDNKVQGVYLKVTAHFSSMEDHWVKILDGNYYTLLVYGRPFGSRFLVEITTHFCSMEDHCVSTKSLDTNGLPYYRNVKVNYSKNLDRNRLPYYRSV